MVAPGKRRRSEDSTTAEPGKAPRRSATVYDAVAGRIGSESFLSSTVDSRSGPIKTLQVRDGNPVYPEEVLFRQQRAPIRYEETDTYFAHERLDPKTQKLPSSDLLKAVHRYASHFYAGSTTNGGKWDWRSMDETALIAMGILLEELIALNLGPTGDLAFVEGEDRDSGFSRPGVWDGQEYRESVVRRTRPSTLRSREAGVVHDDLDNSSEASSPRST